MAVRSKLQQYHSDISSWRPGLSLPIQPSTSQFPSSLQTPLQQLHSHPDHHLLTTVPPWPSTISCNTTLPLRLHPAPPGSHFLTCSSLQLPSLGQMGPAQIPPPSSCKYSPLCVLLHAPSQDPFFPQRKTLLITYSKAPQDAHGTD